MGAITRYELDLDGDGTFESVSTPPRHRFNGAQKVTLRRRVPARMRIVQRDRAGTTARAAARVR